MTYRRNGKQIFAGLCHVADAVNEEQAELLLDRLNRPRIGDGCGDAALAIAEDAFRAGYVACRNDVAHSKQVVSYPGEFAKCINAAWNAYEPPEHIKDLS